ncbi:MAG: hypothetical protein H0W28_11515 [Pyrinomonadaceae bacterium]|nr:hypothetical protein [Pyrinomonadaceae bacterium]
MSKSSPAGKPAWAENRWLPASVSRFDDWFTDHPEYKESVLEALVRIDISPAEPPFEWYRYMGQAAGDGRIVILENGVRLIYDIYHMPPAARRLGLIDIQEPVPGVSVDSIRQLLLDAAARKKANPLLGRRLERE